MSSLYRMMLLVDLLRFLLHSLAGLVAIWAALGRPPWFLRIAILGGLLSLWLAVPAHDLILSLGLQSAVVVVLLWLARGRLVSVEHADRDVFQPTRWQFSLLDLLLAFVVFAAIAAFLAAVPADAWRPWKGLLLKGLLSGVCTLVATWVALGRKFLYVRLSALVLISTSLFATGWLTNDLESAWFGLFPRSAGPVLVAIACWLVLFRASGFQRSGKSENSSPAGAAGIPARRRTIITWLARATLVSLSLAIVIPLGVVYCMLINPEPIQETSLPAENGYHALAEAAQVFYYAQAPDVDTASEDELRAFVTGHQRTLDKVRDSLDLPCQVPLEYTTSDMSLMEGQRALTRALLIQGRLGEMEGRTADATETYLYVLRFAHAISRGGMVVHMYGAWPGENYGVRALYGLRDRLTSRECRKVIDTLESLEARRESWDDVLRRDRSWDHHAHNWQGRFINMMSDRYYGPWPNRRKFRDGVERRQAESRLLTCELGIRMYRSEHGSPPEKLGDLVPQYLPAVPDDPFGEGPLVYRRAGGDYLLYSIGQDRKDDGGWHVAPWESPGDLFLAEPPESE